MSKIIYESIVKLETNKLGTGFYVGDRFILTCNHVIPKEENKIKVNDEELEVAKIHRDIERDVALIELKKKQRENYIKMVDVAIEDAYKWSTAGYPAFHRDSYYPLKDNKIVRILSTESVTCYDLMLTVEGGNFDSYAGFSGSPFIINNKVVGIICEEYFGESRAVGIHALSLYYFKNLLNMNSISIDESKVSKIGSNQIQVIEVPLEIEFSSYDTISALFFQPELNIDIPQIHNVWKNNDTTMQAKIDHLFEIGCKQQKSGLNKNPMFILMPEYAIQGVTGIERIMKYLEESEYDNQVAIGGVDGLKKEAIYILIEKSNINQRYKAEILEYINKQDELKWYNCLIVFVKTSKGVDYYIQPKINGSRKGVKYEALSEGRWILHFKTKKEPSLNFFAMFLDDWKGTYNEKKLLELLWEALGDYYGKIQARQHNLGFMLTKNMDEETEIFNVIENYMGNQSAMWDVYDSNAPILMVNDVANHIGSAIYAKDISKYKREDMTLPSYSRVKNCCDRVATNTYEKVIFREKREVIHAVEFTPPFRAICQEFPCKEPVIVHTIDGLLKNDVRYPALPNSVCGYQKIINDIIDKCDPESLLCLTVNDEALSKMLGVKHENRSNVIRHWDFDDVNYKLDYYFKYSNASYNSNCDYWDVRIYGDFFRNLIEVISLFEAADFGIEESVKVHGTFNIANMKYNLLLTRNLDKRRYIECDLSEKLFIDEGVTRLLVLHDEELELGMRTHSNGSFATFTDNSIVYYNSSVFKREFIKALHNREYGFDVRIMNNL